MTFQTILNEMEISAIQHRWKNGEDRKILAKCFDVSERTVFRCTKGIVPDCDTRRRVPRVVTGARAQALRDKGYTVKMIAQRLDRDRCSIQKALRAYRLSSALSQSLTGGEG